MEFFNKKEEVIDLQLTEYGKLLYSRGLFVPRYYSFYDDDIIYDYTYTGIKNEDQNDIQGRIVDTPRLKCQTKFEQTKRWYHSPTHDSLPSGLQYQPLDSIMGTQADLVTNMPDKSFFISPPMGSSELSKQDAPAWEIHFLKGFFTGSADRLNTCGTFEAIPQLHAQGVYEAATVYSAGSDDDDSEDDDSPESDGGMNAIFNLIPEGEDSEQYLLSEEFDDGTSFLIKKDSIIIAVDEINTTKHQNNYIFELYRIDDVEQPAGITCEQDKNATGAVTTNKKEILTPIYLTTNTTDQDALILENFFEIEVDGAIGEELCKIIRSDNVRQGKISWLDKIIDCPEIIGEIKYDIYPHDDKGDKC